MNGRELFVAACHNQQTSRPPVWLMRQAGRYLPEYMELRSRYDFWTMVRTPELAAEATLQPIRRFGMDAAILFSDILIALDALGLTVEYQEGGPVVSPLVRQPGDLARLGTVDPQGAFDYVSQACVLLREKLPSDVALIGFAGAPFTLAAYAAVGRPNKGVHELIAVAEQTPDLYEELLGKLVDIVAELLAAQVRAGVDAVQLFDTWSGQLSPEEYERFALPATCAVIERVAPLGVPIILYVRNAAGLIELASRSGANVLAIDASLDLAAARARTPGALALQGGLSPNLLTAAPARIKQTVEAGWQAAAEHGYIANLGAGLWPTCPIEGVASFVEAAKACDRGGLK